MQIGMCIRFSIGLCILEKHIDQKPLSDQYFQLFSFLKAILNRDVYLGVKNTYK